MKTNAPYAFAFLISACLVIHTQHAAGQVTEFIPGDDNYTMMLAFHRTDTILIVTPDGFDPDASDRELIEAFPFWGDFQKIPHYRYVKERDLSAGDYMKKIQYYGPFWMFRDASATAMPFKKSPGGFIFGDTVYDNPGDAFWYLTTDTSRLFTCSSRGHGFTQYRTYMAGYYQLYVFRDDDLAMTGFADSAMDSPRLNSLPEMREGYFVPYESRHFDFRIAASLDVDSLSCIIAREADLFADTLLNRLGVTGAVRGRIVTYIYASRADLQQFIAAPAWTTVYGKASGNINHLSGFDAALFRHEAAHSIIEQVAGTNPYCFFNEGFAVSTEYFFTPGSLENDLRVARENADMLTPELVYSTTGRFYSLPAAYQVAGVFTRHLEETLGMEKFLNAYAENDIGAALKQETGLDMTQTISLFRQSLLEGVN
jgi:hypothetical protein